MQNPILLRMTLEVPRSGEGVVRPLTTLSRGTVKTYPTVKEAQRTAKPSNHFAAAAGHERIHPVHGAAPKWTPTSND